MAAGAVFELTARGQSGIVFTLDDAGGWAAAVLTAVAAVAWQLVLEYYWHRLMHLPAFYRRFHKVCASVCACLSVPPAHATHTIRL